MDHTRLSKLQGSLERFLHKAKRKSIVFDNIESKKQYKDFYKLVKRGVTKQADEIVTEDLLNKLLADIGKFSDADQAKVATALKKAWKPMSKYVDYDKTLGYLLWSGEQGGTAASKMIGATGKFRLQNSKITAKLGERSTWLLDSMDDSQLTSLRVAVVEGIQKDLTVHELRNSIHAKFEDEISQYRAEMVTRTEFANAATLVSKESYKKNGVERWQWSQPAGEEDDICTDNDGEVRDIGDEFPSGDDRPPAHPNCKCDVIPVLPDDFDASDAWLGE